MSNDVFLSVHIIHPDSLEFSVLTQSCTSAEADSEDLFIAPKTGLSVTVEHKHKMKSAVGLMAALIIPVFILLKLPDTLSCLKTS